VDKAAAIAEKQKSRVDPMYHEKIDHLLDTYARKLAENMNQGFAIDARVPSVMIAGPANFPVGKKEKQNRARDSNMEEWRYIQGLLDKIRSTGMGGISADDPAAIEKLQKKLDGLERSQLIMKEVNAYYRKHGKLDGCALLSPDQIEKLKASMASSWRSDPRPFESYQLTNNNAEIRRVKARIEQLSKQAQQEFSGWEFDGGRVEMNREDNRLQVFFDGKPDADTRAELKSNGFRWAPSVGAWQRQLTDNAIRAADRLYRAGLPALDAGEDIMCTASGQNCRQGQCRHYFFQGSHDRASPSIYYSKDDFSKAIAIVYHIPAREARGKSVKICYWISMRKTS
jgi:hypothetical protein